MELPGDDDPPVNERRVAVETLGGLAMCGLAYSTSANADAERSRATWDTEAPLVTSYRFKARSGKTYAMTRTHLARAQ